MRGKLFEVSFEPETDRITPAGAGKTVGLLEDLAGAEDHPRRCGENCFRVHPASSCTGSPPQVRGKLRLTDSALRTPGITPAGAGKTDEQGNFHSRSWDHPRRCGENLVVCLAALRGSGSPPQVRGKRFVRFCIGHTRGITPAGAGKTELFRSCQAALEDHPRRCGENHAGYNLFAKRAGSPPQVRGKLCGGRLVRGRRRITPAGAGKTLAIRTPIFRRLDHPRRCGENASPRTGRLCGIGSPPQVRGKLISTVLQGITQRITPAGAGKTPYTNRCSSYAQDHPRRCGENESTSIVGAKQTGSPPQVRGKPIVADVEDPSRGITPAGAGKTTRFPCTAGSR